MCPLHVPTHSRSPLSCTMRYVDIFGTDVTKCAATSTRAHKPPHTRGLGGRGGGGGILCRSRSAAAMDCARAFSDSVALALDIFLRCGFVPFGWPQRPQRVGPKSGLNWSTSSMTRTPLLLSESRPNNCIVLASASAQAALLRNFSSSMRVPRAAL